MAKPLSIGILLTLLVYITGTTIASPLASYSNSTTSLNCADFTTCNCDAIYGDYELNCPIAAPIIIVRISPRIRVQIDCTTKDDKDYFLLPDTNVGNIPTLQLTRCPLPKDRPIMSVLNRLKIKEVKALFFSSYGVNNGVTLVRKHLHGLQDLDRLVLSGNELSELPEDLFHDFTKLTWLNLQRNRVHLPRNIFEKLDKLEYLELGSNNLEKLEPGIFRNQKMLKLLNLWGNNFKNITREPFEGLTSLTSLDISMSKVENLEEGAFTYLSELQNINLNGNFLQSLPMDLFVGNPNLERFRLSNNKVKMTTLPNYLFENKTKLGEVSISVGLTEIPGGVFYGASNLQNLSLANNELQTLPDDIFVDLQNLQQLDLSNNQLITLSSIFRQTNKLKVLKLSRNQLRNISRITFEGLTELKELYLNDNDLYEIHHDAFIPTRYLEIIHLQNNHLSFMSMDMDDNDYYGISSPMQELSALKILNLRNNSISTIFRDWTLITSNLQELDLSFNNITMVTTSDLQFTSNDITVNLTNNNILEIDLIELDINAGAQDDKPTPYSNVHVYIENNPIFCNCILLHLVKYFANEIPKAKALIDIVPGTLKCVGPPKLEGRNVVDLKQSDLLCPLDSPKSSIKLCPARCDCNIRLYDKSMIIDCSNRNLTTVPQLPSPADHKLSFIELHLENNNLTSLPTIDMVGISEIREIYASNNYISYVGAENIPPNLTILQLANNNLQYVNISVWEKLNNTSTLRSLSLSANKWRCDCNSLDLLLFIQEKFQIVTDYGHIVCDSGEKLAELSPADFCPVDHRVVIIASVGLAIFGLLIGFLAALYYKFNEEIKVWLFSHNLCLWFVTEEELDKDKKYDAFISYSHKDEEFITEHLVPNLEKGPNPFKLCLHIRDWIVGEWIPTQIAKSVEESRRTIVVLSPNFLESVWGRMEFRTAHSNALTEGRARVIVIIYGEIGNTANLDPELKAYLNMNTYVKWGDPMFWERLRYAMPHPPGIKKSTKSGLVKDGIKSSVDDKLELIIPTPVTPQLTTPPADMVGNNPLTNAKLNGSITENGKLTNGGINGHVNGAFIINTNSKQSDV